MTSTRPRLREGLYRALRMTLFALVVLGAGSWLLLARAEARLDRQLLDAGRTLATTAPGVAPRDAAGEMIINGERLRAATTTSPHGLEPALRFFAARCTASGAAIDQTVARLRDRAPLPEPAEVPGLRDLVLLEEDGDQGYVACLDATRGRGASARERLASYRASGDLSDLGQLRYLYARRTGDHLELAALWTDGAFRVGRVLHQGPGDAPGEDVPGVPRPSGSRRTLSFSRGDGAGRMAMYVAGDREPAAVERSLRADLAAAGWQAADAHGTRGGRRVFTATRGGRTLTYVLGADEEDRASTVVFETR